ncbi:sigma-70 family RNA polymerase sigma factor [Microbacterium sp. UBA3486]|uniref:sigma-70 family RNA polymerase sigma factor n=1 Tax=Microbacterium TaxID=33882 RepID=UPI0025D66BFB|nr:MULTISPECIES: sigma-70 family RNA polymerase sigma factor [Microbacterium]
MLSAEDPLISEYLPVVSGHIVNKYSWMAERGNCLMSLDDLKQVAAIALVKLVSRWDDVLAEQDKTREGNGGLFWWYLKTDVKRAVSKYYRDIAQHGEYDAPILDELGAETLEMQRTSVRAPSEAAGARLTREDIVDFYSLMPLRDKTIIALRYFDELPYPQLADILDAQTKTTRNLTMNAVNRLRAFARNQYIDAPGKVPVRIEQPWSPPPALLTYLRERHRMNLAEYLGIVTIALRVDVSYLVEILRTDRTNVPGAMASTMTSFQCAAADELLRQGETMREVARRLDVSYGVIVSHAKRRQSLAA